MAVSDLKKNSSILLVEDEYDIRQLISLHLKRKGYEVEEAVDGVAAHNILETKTFNLLILDWMLPGMNGFDLLSLVRKKPHSLSSIPVLFVTAKSEPQHIISALENGADDYIVKPFDVLVFLARVASLLRRQEMQKSISDPVQNTQLNIGDMVLNRDSFKIFIKDQEISLTLSEFLLLEALLKNQGRVLSRQQLASYIQGEDINVTSRTIDTHTSVLRKKIGEYGKMIETVRGVGYRIGYVSNE